MKDFQITAQETCYQGFFRINRYTIRHTLFAGGWVDDVQRELFERGHAVAVLPYDPKRDTVVLIEQFRIGAAAHAETVEQAWLLEIIAGVIEDGETAERVAERESHEEAGCVIEELMPIQHIYVSPGGTSETTQLFCGLVDSQGIGGVHGLPEEHEDIFVSVLPFVEAMELLNTGKIQSAPAVIALQWLALHHDVVLQQWS